MSYRADKISRPPPPTPPNVAYSEFEPNKSHLQGFGYLVMIMDEGLVAAQRTAPTLIST